MRNGAQSNKKFNAELTEKKMKKLLSFFWTKNNKMQLTKMWLKLKRTLVKGLKLHDKLPVIMNNAHG